MSAPLYNTAMPIPPRRNPLSAVHHHFAVNQATSRHPPPARPTTPPKPQRQEQPKPQKSPPLPRQNAKVPPPSPPRVIVDRSRNIELMRVGMLGEVRPPSLPVAVFLPFPCCLYAGIMSPLLLPQGGAHSKSRFCCYGEMPSPVRAHPKRWKSHVSLY